jgi:hypothetical protein
MGITQKFFGLKEEHIFALRLRYPGLEADTVWIPAIYMSSI